MSYRTFARRTGPSHVVPDRRTSYRTVAPSYWTVARRTIAPSDR